MKLADLNTLTLENIGSWPLAVRIVVAALLFAVLLGAGYLQDISGLQSELTAAEDSELQLKQTFETKQRKAANLSGLKEQLVDIEQTFGDLLKRLPNKTEVAALLVDISQQGLGAGLEFELFRPGSETPTDFYVELPIQIRVVGDYHSFGKFISGMSDLPRIVTNHNISITPLGSSGKLVLETTAKTYRYMDEGEEAAGNAKAPGK